MSPEERDMMRRVTEKAAEVSNLFVETLAAVGTAQAMLHLMWESLDDEAADIIAEHPDLAEVNVQMDSFYFPPGSTDAGPATN